MRTVVLLGAPGAGKGTQAARLAEALSLPHVATGDLFRDHRARETELGRQAQEWMSSGRLVPDELVLEMLFERVSRPDCREGFLLDGFPRTLPQALALDARLDPKSELSVVQLAVGEEALVERAAGRRLCRSCGRVCHLRFSPPAREGVCDHCGGELYQREDDAPEVVRQRLAVYREQTEPVVEHYREQGVLRTVDGEREPDEVFAELQRALGGRA